MSRLAKFLPKDPATWPLVAVTGFAGALVVFQGWRMFTSHPDIYLAKQMRSTVIRSNEQEACDYYDHPFRALKDRKPHITPRLNRMFGAEIGKTE